MASGKDTGKFSEFVKVCKEIEEVSSHTEKTSVMKDFLEDFKGDVYLLYKLLFAKEDKRKFNLKDKKLVEIAASAFGEDHDEMLDHMDSKGDVSETLKKYLVRSGNARDKGVVNLKQVDEFLEKLTTITTKDDQTKAFEKFVVGNLTGDEMKFITRIICKDLKIRAGPKFLLAALNPDAYACYILTHDLKQIIDAVTNKQDLKNLSLTAQTQSLDIDALIRDAGSDDDEDNKKFNMNISDDESDDAKSSSKKKKDSKSSGASSSSSSKASSSKASSSTKSKKKDVSDDDTDNEGDDEDIDVGENIDDNEEEKPEDLIDEDEDSSSKKKKTVRKSAKIKAKMVLFSPVKPMLARPSKTYDDVINRCPNGFYCELKYDGERIQIHYDRKKDKIKYFSRNLKDVQDYKIESVKKYISRAIKDKVESVILDGEILMYDTKKKKPLPFGTLGKKVRQDHPNAVTAVYLFDILYYNGKSLLSVPIYKRKALLSKIVNVVESRVMLGEHVVVKGPKGTREALIASKMQEMISEGEEGLVFKDLCSPYEPNARHWLKMKKDYLQGMADSVDLVVLGAYLGTGSKGGLMSVFMMGSYDKKEGKWRIICKCGNGHDDATLEALNEELKSNMKRISKDPSLVPDDIDIHTNALVPDYIVKDISKSVVWEITGAEFSVSSRKERPISIRFPRVTKIRDDKDVDDATNYQELTKLYQVSTRKGPVALFPKKGKDDDDDNDDSDDSVDVKAGGSKKRKARSKKSKDDSDDDENEKGDNSDDDKPTRNKKTSSKRQTKNSNKKSDDDDTDDDQNDTAPSKKKTKQAPNKLTTIKDIPDSSKPEEIYYIYGDFGGVPANKDKKFIAHCVDDSSRWGDKGSMGNIVLLFGEGIKKAYVDDMNTVGDVQLVISESNYLSNLICLQFVQKGSPPKIDYSSFDECLKKCATYMIEHDIKTFHLFRLHYGITGLDWSRCEKLLKENMSNKGIVVYVYTKDRDDKDRVTESKAKLNKQKETTMSDENVIAMTTSNSNSKKEEDKMDLSSDDVKQPAVSSQSSSQDKSNKTNSSQPVSHTATSISSSESSSAISRNIFSGVIALISGYPQHVNNEISDLILKNGGTVTQQWNLIGEDANTHLITETKDDTFNHCFSLGAIIVAKSWVTACVTKGKLVETNDYVFPLQVKENRQTSMKLNASSSTASSTVLTTNSSSSTTNTPVATLVDLFTEFAIYLHKDIPSKKMHTRYIVAYDGEVYPAFCDEVTHVVTAAKSLSADPSLSSYKEKSPIVKIVSSEWIWHSINSGQLIDYRFYELK